MDSNMPITCESDDYSSAMFGNFDVIPEKQISQTVAGSLAVGCQY